MFVKLCAVSGRASTAVRVLFIKAGEKFIVRNIPAGTYDVRYKNLDNGRLAKSESFDLTEKQEKGGMRYSTIELTLYKVSQGNMKVYPVSEENF